MVQTHADRDWQGEEIFTEAELQPEAAAAAGHSGKHTARGDGAGSVDRGVGLVVGFPINPMAGSNLGPCLCNFRSARPQATESGSIHPARKSKGIPLS